MKTILISIFCALNLISFSQQWEPTYGPACNDILSFTSFNNKLFIGTFNGTFYSENDGISWQQGSITGMVRSFGVCGAKLFAAADYGNNGPQGFFQSSDGINWQSVDSVNTMGAKNILIESNNIYVSDYSKIHFSPDTGITWLNIAGNLPNGEINGMIKLNQKIYVTKSFYNGNNDTVYSKSDTSFSWVPHTITFNSGWLGRIATDGIHLFVATGNGGVLISADEGNTWQAISDGLPENVSVEDLIIKGQTMYSATRNGIYQCSIGTYNWTLMSLPDKFIMKLFFHGQDLYAGTNGDGLFKSSDEGNTWQQITNGIYAGKQISYLAKNGNEIWAAGSYWGGLYKSLDQGNTWNKINVQRFTSLYVDGNNIYGGDFDDGINEGGIWVSHDAGLNFFRVSIPNSYRFYAIAGNTSVIYASDNITNQLYQSSDDGTNWNIDTTLNNVNTLFADDTILYAGTGNGIYRKTNGTAWQACSVPQATSVYAFAKMGFTVFCMSGLGILKSSDGGIYWDTTLSNGFPESSSRFHLTAVDSNLYVYVAQYGPYGSEIPLGVYTSTDYGDTWTEENTGLEDLQVNCLLEHNSKLYAGISYDGVYRFNPNISTTQSEFSNPDSEILIFPNPSSSTFTIIFANGEPRQLEIYNTLGEKILTQPAIQKQETIDLSSEAKGIYFIEIISEGKKEMREIVLE